MRIDTGKITASQFMFSVACFIQASTLLTAFLSPITRQDSLIVTIAGSLIFIPLIWAYTRLMQRFPDSNLAEINEIVFGRVIGKTITIFYLVFFVTLTSLNLRDVDDFLKDTILIKTPTVVILALFAAVCAWAVHYGIRVVTRYSSLFVLIALAILTISMLFAVSLMKMENFLPMLDLEPMRYLQGTNIIMTIPFGELVVFLMIGPNIRKQKKSIYRYWMGGFAIGAVTLLTVVFRDTAVLGNTQSLFSLPSFETYRMISISPALSRMEILFAVVLIILYFFKVSFLYYVSVLTAAHLFGLKTYQSMVLTAGVFFVIYSITIFTSTMDDAGFGQGTAPIIWTLFEYTLPLTTLLMAAIRKLPRETRTS